MDPLIRMLVVGILIAIIASLGLALFHLARGGASDKLVRALTVRIGLSVGLFVLLMLAWYTGLITPHGLGR
ncbi:MAG TPA: twin transmembrane helix small protein [Steroidobacteraceae bacterium]|nr:twin transmembrane helix small protein [Steroidobacteraceae bacterium]